MFLLGDSLVQMVLEHHMACLEQMIRLQKEQTCLVFARKLRDFVLFSINLPKLLCPENLKMLAQQPCLNS